MAHASGKCILLGEHAVVYGVPALVAGLDRGARATAVTSSEARFVAGDHGARPGDGTELGKAFEALLASLGAGPHEVRVELEMPAGVGLGASAVIGVASARAVLEAMGQPLELPRVVEAGMAWERVFHGNPSGVDVWAAAYGGCMRYVKGEGAKPVRVGRDLHLAVAVAGPAASTKEMVESVARQRARKPEMFERTLEGIRSLVENAELCIEAGDVPGLGKLMDLNHMLLAGLFLSTQELEKACAAARAAGAHGAKLTGAGGGGCVIALTDADDERVLEAFRSEGLECFTAKVPKTETVTP